ncbi:MAG: ATP-binding protein [Saprospiraceae bacterium]|nr:ATP-binding protein [Saprospiraceae bacterium]
MIPRSYLEILTSDLASSHKIIVVYGARQVGKTTLVRELLKAQAGKVLEINADERPYWEVLSSRDWTKLRALVEGYDILFIDEAQRIPDIGINLKILHDKLPALRIIVTGSSSLDLANRIQEPLTGRAWTYVLYPISVDEWRRYTGANAFETQLALESFLRFGMYPEIFTLSTPAQKQRYLQEITNSYLYKDILVLANIKFPEKLQQLLKLLAYQIGSEVSIQELSKSLQIHREAVVNYLDLLEKAFVVFRLGGFSRNLQKEITKMDKIYFMDIGIRNALVGNFNELSERNDVGQLWENFLLAERIKYNAYRQRFANYYFWRTYYSSELDLVEEAEGRLMGYEFKWGKRRNAPPSAWVEAYPHAGYECYNLDNFMEFLGERQ